MKEHTMKNRHLFMRAALCLPVIVFMLFPAMRAQAQISLNTGGANGGAVIVGTSTTGCAAGIAGGVRYNTTSKCLELCDGASWACISVAACGDATPNAFSFNDLVNQATAALVTSNILQIGGISCVVNVAASGEGSPQFRTCSDAACSTVLLDWTTAGTIDNNQYLQLRLTTSAIGGDTHSATVAVGTAASVWNATPTGDCTGTPAPGTVCPDGTVYAGITPDGDVKMYVTRCDAGMSWNGTACAGIADLKSWNHGESSNFVGTLATSEASGASNTAMIAPLDANSALPGHQDHYAAVHCENLNQDGHTDWYLPARSELAIIYANGTVIGNFGTTSYWSSTEGIASSNRARARNFGGVGDYDPIKYEALRVRCARK